MLNQWKLRKRGGSDGSIMTIDWPSPDCKHAARKRVDAGTPKCQILPGRLFKSAYAQSVDFQRQQRASSHNYKPHSIASILLFPL